MVIEINMQIKENFSKSQMVGSFDRNLAFVTLVYKKKVTKTNLQ